MTSAPINELVIFGYIDLYEFPSKLMAIGHQLANLINVNIIVAALFAQLRLRGRANYDLL